MIDGRNESRRLKIEAIYATEMQKRVIEKGWVPLKGLHYTTGLHDMHCPQTWPSASMFEQGRPTPEIRVALLFNV